ncbi:MAG: DMT family transporter [Oscillospiraceae bacterium]
MREKKTKYVLFILLQSLLYGVGNPVTKLAYEAGITPFWLLAGRFAVTSLVFLCLFGGRIRRQLKGVAPGLWIPAALCCAGAYISCNLALDMTGATTVGFLFSLPVLFTPILSALVTRRYDLRRLPVQLVLTAGLFLLCCGDSGLSFGPGEALGLFDALCVAGVLVFGERALARIDAAVLSSLQAFVTLGLSLLGALLLDDVSVLPGVGGEAWCVVLYLALGCTVLAYLLQNYAVAHLSAAEVSMLQCTQPILTALVSFLLLGETLSRPAFAGAAVILLCLLLDGWRQRRREERTPS